MAVAELTLPPGIYRNGTAYQSKGRWFDCNHVRWFEGRLGPTKGWVAHSDEQVEGAARAIIAWVDNSSARWIGIGTHSHLYAMNRPGDLYDITPVGFTGGRADAANFGGYGTGGYGGGAYGTPRVDVDATQDATVWTLDTFGQDLIGCNADDGRVYQWSLDTGSPAEAIENAPVNNRAVIVTEEGMIMLLGAGGDPRMVHWSDTLNPTEWTPSSSNNLARFQRLQTIGRLMCARKTNGGLLVFTDVDVFLATYRGLPDVYNFERKGTGCGIISQAAAAVTGDGLVAWMGAAGFWMFNGYVAPLPSEMSDYAFSDINLAQRSKVFAHHNNSFGEIEWWYPSGGAVEVDRFVRWNYRENHWAKGELTRLCGVERGALNYPLMVDADGTVFEHETGFDYGGAQPFAETGPMELGDGERVMRVSRLWPDERLAGQVSVSFTTSLQGPNSPETEYGPYDLSSPTDVMFEARQVRMRFTGQVLGDWRVGNFRADTKAMGKW